MCRAASVGTKAYVEGALALNLYSRKITTRKKPRLRKSRKDTTLLFDIRHR
jgi:hypothetical protein